MKELLIHNVKEKLNKEMPTNTSKSNPESLIAHEVRDALLSFCKQESRLADAIINSDKKFSDCLKEILKDTKAKQYISDFEAYRRAVAFYLPEALVECCMTVKTKDRAQNLFSVSLEDFV